MVLQLLRDHRYVSMRQIVCLQMHCATLCAFLLLNPVCLIERWLEKKSRFSPSELLASKDLQKDKA